VVDITPIAHLYPFQSNWIDLDTVRYHYLDEGPRDAPAAVMLHGNPTWSFYYRTLIPALSQTYRIIVPDHIGCGLSDKPQNYTYTLDQHIRNLETLLGHLNLSQFSLVLHDWGGVIGMGYATRHPERISSFIIFNTAAFVLKKLPLRILVCRPRLLGAVLVRGLNAFAGLATRLAVNQPMPTSIRAGYLAPYNNWANRIAIHRFVQDIPWEDNHPTRPLFVEIDTGLGQFQDYPMLIIWGAKDFVFTEKDFFAEWQRRFPQAETHVLPEAGHYVVEDAHSQILPWLQNFLGKNA
jgi:haloalkane dehalogenase